jgi:hypothetical protein
MESRVLFESAAQGGEGFACLGQVGIHMLIREWLHNDGSLESETIM